MQNFLKRVQLVFIKIAFIPLIKGLWRQKYSLLMVIMQIALALAVLSNSLYISNERIYELQRSSGIDEEHSFVLTSSGFTADFNAKDVMQRDLKLLRNHSNIINAVATYSFPYSGTGDWDDLQIEAGSNQNKIAVAGFNLDENGIEALGLNLIAGQNFDSLDVEWQTDNLTEYPNHVLITAQVAKDLFNTTQWASVIGKTIYINERNPTIIKGIISQLHAPWGPKEKIENSVIYPRVLVRNSARYFIRVKTNLLANTMAEVEHRLSMQNQTRMIRKVQSISDLKHQVQGPDIAAVTILAAVCTTLITIAGLGIAGLTNLNVQQRKKTIGIRRALGASRIDILRQLFIENSILTSIGVLVGAVFSIGLNIFLVEQYALTKLPLSYIVWGSICLFLLSYISILIPVLKAINVSPAIMTKSQTA